MAHAMSLGLDHALDVAAPLAHMHKAEVVTLGRELGVPLELTLSCNGPIDGRHCGRCNKCRERREAFADAGLDDPAVYDVA